jgi:two-component system nitrogen regulation response regulator NtrX
MSEPMMKDPKARVPKASILVVDDEKDIRQICVRALTNAGYKAFTAPDAALAREIIAREALDMLIVDIYMPEEDGISLLRHVHETQPGLPAILITGFAGTNTVIDAIRLNVRDYLCKPFTFQQLLSAVKAGLE